MSTKKSLFIVIALLVAVTIVTSVAVRVVYAAPAKVEMFKPLAAFDWTVVEDDPLFPDLLVGSTVTLEVGKVSNIGETRKQKMLDQGWSLFSWDRDDNWQRLFDTLDSLRVYEFNGVSILRVTIAFREWFDLQGFTWKGRPAIVHTIIH